MIELLKGPLSNQSPMTLRARFCLLIPAGWWAWITVVSLTKEGILGMPAYETLLDIFPSIVWSVLWGVVAIVCAAAGWVGNRKFARVAYVISITMGCAVIGCLSMAVFFNNVSTILHVTMVSLIAFQVAMMAQPMSVPMEDVVTKDRV